MAAPTLTISPEQRMNDLGRDIVAAACLRGQFALPSGAMRSYAIDPGLLTTRPVVLRRLADALSPMIPPETDRLAAASPEAVPLVTAVSLRFGLPSLYVRDQGRDRLGWRLRGRGLRRRADSRDRDGHE
jgi:orotate phosphoribosyltransferase